MKRNLLIISALAFAFIIVGAGFWVWQTRMSVPSAQSGKAIAKPQAPIPKSEPQKAVEAALLRFAPQNGQTLVYQFEAQTEAEVDFGFLIAQTGMDTDNAAKTEKTAVLMKAAGDLCLKFYDLKAGTWNVAAFLDGLTYQVNGVTPSYAKALEFPFVFQMNAGGYLSDFRFTEDIPGEARAFIRQILLSLQTGLPAEAKTKWNTREIDATGTYRAEYKVEDDTAADSIRLGKRKLEYVAIDAAKELPNAQIRLEQSRNTITVPRAGAWLLSLEGEEASTSSVRGVVWGKSAARYSALQISRDVAGRFPADFGQFLARLSSQQYKQSKYYTTDEQFNQLGANLDLNGALAKYAELRDSGINNAQSAAEAFMVNYLRQHPQACFDLVAVMDQDPKRERLDQSTQLILWKLITEAGHTEAQQAVIQAATDPKFSDLTHIRAVAYIHDFENPEPFLAEKLMELHRSLPEDYADPNERELKSMSLYAVGSLGYKDKENDELKPEIGRQLTGNLKRATTPEEQTITLSAIGNYGGAEVLDAITPFFASPDDGVRAAAYDALRRMDDPRAFEILASSIKTETAGKVRERAYFTFAAMPPTAVGIAWAKTEIFTVANPKEQESLVKVLGENLKTHPENEQTLRDFLKTDPDNRVKKDVYKYITPQ